MTTPFELQLPENLEAERLVLGSLMLGSEVDLIAETLEPRDFVSRSNQLIFSAILALAKDGRGIDRVTVAAELQTRSQLETAGGIGYLCDLDRDLPRVVNLDGYVSIVRDNSVLRKAMAALHSSLQQLLARAVPTSEALAWIERKIQDLSEITQAHDRLGALEIIADRGGLMSVLYPEQKRSAAIPTPWSSLNHILEGGGFYAGQMVTIGARPSLGKSALAAQIAMHAASLGHLAIVFSLEMSPEQILRRMFYTAAKIDRYDHQRNELTVQEIDHLHATAEKVSKLPMLLSQDYRTVPGMRSAVRRAASKQPVGIVIVDYLGMMDCTGRHGKRYEEITELSRGLKVLAEEMRVPIVVCAQLNREIEKDKRKPRPSDMRDSGSIEQDSDIILMPYQRPEQTPGSSLFVDLLVCKQRDGMTGEVPMKFERRYTRYVELDPRSGGAQERIGWSG